MKLPLKFRLLQYISANNGCSLDKIYYDLLKEYEYEKHYSMNNILNHIFSLQENCLITAKSSESQKDIDLYFITSYGEKMLLKFL